MKIEWNKDLCKFCELCINLCPMKALEFKDLNLIVSDKCNMCKICEKYCPDLAIKVKK